MSDTPTTFGPITDQLFGSRHAGDLLEKTGTKHVVYPPGLATSSVDSKNRQNQIPYVLFMPYLPPRGLDAFHSLEPGAVLDHLPAPEFSIALPIPSSALKTTYGVKYDEIELGQGLGAMMGAGGKLAGSLSNLAKSTLDSRTSPGEAIQKLGAVFGAESAATLIAQLGYQVVHHSAELVGAGSAVNKLVGVVENPFTEHIFQKVDARTHTFTYTFLPKNLGESQTIDNIIELFKFYMLPANQAANGGIGGQGQPIFFSFPYEFQIVYSVGATTFQLLPSVLETLSVDYADSVGSPKFFTSDTVGKQYPAKIDLTLVFQEVMLLTRDKIKVEWGGSDMPDKPEGASVSRYRF